MYIEPPQNKPAVWWKRLALVLLSLVSIGLAGVMSYVYDSRSVLQFCVQWGFVVFFGGCGIWILAQAIRGDAKKVDKTIDEMMSGL
jgi:hypothetical protein